MNILEKIVGQTVDAKYLIEQRLEQGGMGAVYKGVHVGTGRPVAVKVIRPDFMHYSEFIERFKREARAAGQLRHPNVVDVTDFGFAEVNGEHLGYLVMEYLNGCTLREVLKEDSRLPLNWTIDILEQVCLAVAKAHRQGIIHRDLKPDNIWLEPNDRGGYTVKVLDFGLAKLGYSSESRLSSTPALPETLSVSDSVAPPTLDEELTMLRTPQGECEAVTVVRTDRNTYEQKHGTEPRNNLTQAGSLLGTPLYMSPEQCVSAPLSSATDIYSIGVIAYEMLTGETPFKGGVKELIYQHVEASVRPIKELRADIPARVDELILQALAKKAEQRPVSAEAFASALRARAETAGSIMRKALGIYSEHLSCFLQIGLMSVLPQLIAAVVLIINTYSMKSPEMRGLIKFTMPISIILAIISIMCSQAISSGVFVPVVAQLQITPLRPLQIRAALQVLRKRLRNFLLPAFISSFMMMLSIFSTIFAIGFLFFFYILYKSSSQTFFKFLIAEIVALTMSILLFYALNKVYLYAPAVIMESRRGLDAIRRSRQFYNSARKVTIQVVGMNLALILGETVFFNLLSWNMIRELGAIASASVMLISQVFIISLRVLLLPFFATCTALLYFKIRQSDGETMTEILSGYAPEALPPSHWQVRMREQLSRVSRSGSNRASVG